MLVENGCDRTEICTSREVLCKVNLVEGALKHDSLEKLASLHVVTGVRPRKDKSLAVELGIFRL